MKLNAFLSRARRHAPAIMLGVALAAPTAAWAQSQPLFIPGKHSLYQRIITRPGAVMATSAGGTDTHPVPGFEVYYVYARDPKGWLQVGAGTHGPATGWIEASRTMDWQHAMIGTFTNPAGRQRALFVRTADEEKKLIVSPTAGDDAKKLEQAATGGHSNEVVALEPENMVDISKSFYLLPILQAQQIERDSGPPMRMLKVVSAPAQTPGTTATPPEKLHDFKADLVFVVDTTQSMGPYIEQTRQTIREIVNNLHDSGLRDNFRFGLIGYRDSLTDNPKLEYATKLFAKPDFSQPIETVLPEIDGVHDTNVSSASFDEDPIAGIKAAIDNIDWDSVGGRYIVLVTDAGARTADNPHSVTHLGIEEIRQLAASKGIALFVLHLQTPAAITAHDSTTATSQYKSLSRFGSGGNLYYPVPGGSPEAFRPVVQSLSAALMQQVSNATDRPIGGMSPQDNAPASSPDPRVAVVGQAMRLAYLGREQKTQAPDAIESYTADRDLADPLKKTLDIRVLLTRNQLSDLATALHHILDAGLAGRTEPQTFFTQLRAAFAASARDPGAISHIDKVGGLLGEYLDGLPYKSDIASISEDTWLAMGAIGQKTILNHIESRLRLYEEYEAHPELWVALNQSDDAGDKSYPVPLEDLP